MSAFRHLSPDQMDDQLRAARRLRSETLVALCARFWARLTGRVPAEARANYA